MHNYLQSTILTFKLKFYLEDGLVKLRYFEFFSWPGLYFHPTKDRCSTRPSSPFFTFVLILVIFAAQFFSVDNLGHKELKKSSKYELVIFLDEKPRFTLPTFCTFLFKGRP